MKKIFFPLYRLIIRLRSPRTESIASFVDDPLKVQKEMHFLFVRLLVFFVCAIVVIIASVISIRRGVRSIEEQRGLQQRLYSRFESMARLSHDVTEGRVALAAVEARIPKDDNLLPFLRAVEAQAKETKNTATFRFTDRTSTPMPDGSPYHFIRFTIVVEGDVRTFFTYLAAFAKLPYLVTIESVALQGADGLSGARSSMEVKGKLIVQ
ncbi:hypothetical protein HY625_01625 [Candidatus Uhrbacteria bacterium]|nr:hypothetical protein [Candidatus Uhrbacteria bacterium]